MKPSQYIKLFLVVSFIIWGVYRLTVDFIDILDNDKRLKSVIGKSVILNKDTLVVTDYSLLKSEYTLSNGVTVAENFKFTFIK